MIFLRFLIMIIPFNKLKILLYNRFFKYEIDYSCKIGFSYINCEKVVMKKNSQIGNFNYISYCKQFVLEENSKIVRFNKFKEISLYMGSGSEICVRNRFIYNSNVDCKLGSNIIIGKMSIITVDHFFDLTENIYIGNDCVIAGRNTEFWTHGFDLQRNRLQGEIIIRDNIYIGAGSKFNFGVEVNSHNVIAMGSILTKSFNDTNNLIGGVPAVKIKKLDSSESKFKFVGYLPNYKKIYRKDLNN